MIITTIYINYLIIKTNLSNSSKMLKTYKLLGVKKSDVYKFYILENIIMNIIVLIISVFLLSYIVYKITQIEIFKYVFILNIGNVFYSIIICTLNSLIIGCFLVNRFLNKPSL